MRFYRPLPADWLLILPDISGSTRAVETGKYAEVNYVGATCIVAVHNALPEHDVPCVFGGDGATLAISPSLRAATVEALSATQRWARHKKVIVFRFSLRPGGFEPEQYKHEMTVNADFKKVSGMLRMIIDCTVTQANEIETALGKMHADGLIHFGTNRSDQAIMTCVTPNRDNHEHVHFIDGGDGGLYRAAGKLKAQIAADSS